MKSSRLIAILFAFSCLFSSCKKGDDTNSNGAINGNTGSGGSTQTTLLITDFSPKTGEIGATTITIKGTGFGSDISAVSVAVGGSSYDHPVSVTPTSIVMQANLTATTGKITVAVNGSKVTSTDNFTALPVSLQVLGFTGSAAQLGSSQLGHQMFISGQGFGTDTSKIFISFGGTTPVKANYLSTSGLTIGTIVPRYAQAGKVTVTINGISVISTADFNLDPSLRDYSPKTFSSGDTVKITGVGFTTINDMSINFNTTTGSITRPISLTPTQMFVVVPFNATSGYLYVTANSGTVSDRTDDKYTFVPTVSFNNVFTPSSGKVNDLIRINGDFSGADISTLGVSFGGSKFVQPTTITGPDIYVKVPSDAKTGKITISRTGYKSFTGSFIFTVSP